MLKPLDFKALKTLCNALHNYFKESKKLLGLGKNQSQDFDAQIASSTISFIQYMSLV